MAHRLTLVLPEELHAEAANAAMQDDRSLTQWILLAMRAQLARAREEKEETD